MLRSESLKLHPGTVLKQPLTQQTEQTQCSPQPRFRGNVPHNHRTLDLLVPRTVPAVLQHQGASRQPNAAPGGGKPANQAEYWKQRCAVLGSRHPTLPFQPLHPKDQDSASCRLRASLTNEEHFTFKSYMAQISSL